MLKKAYLCQMCRFDPYVLCSMFYVRSEIHKAADGLFETHQEIIRTGKSRYNIII